jgi:hypothetical protein
MSSLEQSDKEVAAVATHPRVTLQDIKDSIAWTTYIQDNALFQVLGHASIDWNNGEPPTSIAVEALKLLTICLVVTKTGFTILGKSAPASPENFNAELGRKLAYEDCIRQLWPLMGFALKERLAKGA